MTTNARQPARQAPRGPEGSGTGPRAAQPSAGAGSVQPTLPPEVERKRRLLIGILRLAKEEGFAPPSKGVAVYPGTGECRCEADRIVVYQHAPVESWIHRAVDWVEGRALAERLEASRERDRKAGDPSDPYNRIRRLELDDGPAAAPAASAPEPSARIAKVELD